MKKIFLQTGHKWEAFLERNARAQFAQRGIIVAPTATLGDCAHIGDNVRIGAGAQVGERCEILAHAVVGAGAQVGDRALIGTYCTLERGVCVGEYSRIAADLRLTEDVPANRSVNWHGRVRVLGVMPVAESPKYILP